MRTFVATIVAAVAWLVGVPPAAAAPGVETLCRLRDDRIVEASGIARGIASPGVLYVQNDSGDTNRFFALDARTCATVATITVPHAENIDWEDIAVARDAAGTPSVWLADIGDNAAARAEIAVYRIDEPRLRPSGRDQALRTGVPDVWRLRYPGGPVNAESLAVTPHGVGYLVTKSPIGESVFYRLPPRPDARHVQVLARVGSFQFTPTSAGGPVELARQMAATGAAISADGFLLVVRTYTDAYLWTMHGDDVITALNAAPIRVALPVQPQGEGVDLDANRLLIDSEGRGSAVDAVAIPRGDTAATTTKAPTSRKPTPSSASSTTGGHGGGSWVPGIVVLGLAVLGALGWWTLQLRGRAGR